MAELLIDLEPLPAPQQLAYVEAALRNSFKVRALHAADGRLRIEHDEPESADAIRAMTRRFVFISKNIDKDQVFRTSAVASYAGDPQPALEARKDVIPIEPGFYSFQGDFLRVFRAIDRQSRAIADELGALEQEHPTVWPVRLFRMIDYFHEFPQQMILCAPVKDDFATRSAFSKRFRKDEEFSTVPMDGQMAESSYGLQPAVCDCCYYVLEGSRTHQDRFYTTCNKVFRNERSPTRQLDRLTNFTVRDIMFVGSEAFVLEARQKLIERMARFLSALHLEAGIETANDPFFANDSAMKSVFQNAHRLKYELLARIPHLGREIAIGSINLHTDFFGKAFDIRMADGSVAHSGCVGFGYERLVYALFCQHGPELRSWPRELLEYLALETTT